MKHEGGGGQIDTPPEKNYPVIVSLINLSDIAIITVIGADYCCIIDDISIFEAIRLLENSVLDGRGHICISKKSILKIKSTAIIFTIQSKQKR